MAALHATAAFGAAAIPRQSSARTHSDSKALSFRTCLRTESVKAFAPAARTQYCTRVMAVSTGVTTASSVNAATKIRIKLKAYDVELLKESVTEIIGAATTTGAAVSGPVPLPTRIRRYCVLRSPHVNKDSREHFEIRTHSRLLDIKNPSAQTIDKLMQLDLPSGVDVEVKL